MSYRPDTGRIADVHPFTPDYKTMQIPIVDVAVRYECPFNGQTYTILIRYALPLVPLMTNNPIPPFVMQEAAVKVVMDTLTIQTTEPTEEDHSIYFPETNFRIHLSRWGMLRGDGEHPSTCRSPAPKIPTTTTNSKSMKMKTKRVIPDIEDTVKMNGKLLNQQPAYDKTPSFKVSLQLVENMSVGKITKHALGPDGAVAGTYDENP